MLQTVPGKSTQNSLVFSREFWLCGGPPLEGPGKLVTTSSMARGTLGRYLRVALREPLPEKPRWQAGATSLLTQMRTILPSTDGVDGAVFVLSRPFV